MGPKVFKVVAVVVALAVPTAAFVVPARADPPGDLVALVNSLRGGVSVAPLATDAQLTSVAQQWANHMAATAGLAHNPDLATQAPTGWTKIGENIGDGYSLAAVYNALAASAAGRSNMVDPTYNRTGVGVAVDSHGQVWVAEDFGAYPPPPTPTLVFPTDGVVVFPGPQTFSWQQTPGATYYCLTVGSSLGGTDFVNSGLLAGTQLNDPVGALPGGQPLWARVYAYVQGTWTWTDIKFSAAGPSTAAFTRPLAGATSVDTNKPFTWTAAPTAGYYVFTIGTTLGASNVVNSGILPATTTGFAVPALPTGKVLWARVYSYLAGSWVHFNDVSFTAAPR